MAWIVGTAVETGPGETPEGVEFNSLNEAMSYVLRQREPLDFAISNTRNTVEYTLDSDWRNKDRSKRWVLDNISMNPVSSTLPTCNHPHSGCRCPAETKLLDQISQRY